MKKHKKMIIPIIFVMIFIIVMLSGCIYREGFPVDTWDPRVKYQYTHVHLLGEVGVPFCKARNHLFVYDTESHEDWEEYQYSRSGSANPDDHLFATSLYFYEVQYKVTYYVRGVAYCYDFKYPFKDYEEGYYQGEEVTFYIDL